jgi:ArsR family transcriptional regulator, arsenate/arsenite/antimonite-responsive transcriptional repressor
MTAAGLFRAFADPTRLRILNLLREQKELCVCDLCAALGESQPKVSRHLAVLRRAQLVDVHREGKWMYYSLAAARSPLQRTLLRCLSSCLGDRDELVEDRARLRGLALRLRCVQARGGPR